MLKIKFKALTRIEHKKSEKDEKILKIQLLLITV